MRNSIKAEKKQSLQLPPFRLYQPKLTHPNWQDLYHEAAKLASEIAKNIDLKKDPLAGTIFQKRRFLALIKTLKNLFINKGKMAKNDHNFIPLFYIWTMTNQCNFLCSYCSNHRGGKYPELYRQGLTNNLTTAQGMKLLEIMKESSAIYFCGGEPTLRRDLPELLNYSTKLNMFNMINTNGSLLGDLLLNPRYRKFLSQMDVIIVSLDALNISEMSEMYKVNDTLSRKVLRNILALRILQNFVHFKLVVNTVINPYNIEESFDILNWCNDLGICFSPVSANIDHEPNYKLLNNPRYQALVTIILERANQGFPMIASPRMLKRLLRAKNIFCHPKVFDHIDYDGRLFWPCKAYQKAVMINIFDYKNVKQMHQAAKKMLDATNFHGDGTNQCHGHCAWMQNVVNDTYARALIQGLFGSGIINEIRGLMG